MLVKLHNIGSGLRLIHDVNGVLREVRPGAPAMDIDLAEKAVKRFQKAEAMGDTMTVELVEEFGDPGEADRKENPERTSEFTLRENEGLDRTEQPTTLKEKVTGRTAQEPPARRNLDPQDPNNGNPPAERVRLNKVKKNAEPKKAPVVIETNEPKTAGELMANERNFSEADFLRIACKVLPKNVLPQRPKRSQILNALKAQAKKDGSSTGAA